MEGDETEGRRVKHHIHMVLYIVPLSGILMGVLVLGLIFCVVTHKGNSRSSALQRHPPPAIPHRQTTVARRAVPCRAPQTEEEVETIFFSLKNQPLFTALHRLQHYGGKNYRRKRLFATTRSKIVTILKKNNAAMRYWNCQIKHTVGEVSKQLFVAK